jgi:hypothetical protein
VKWLGIKFLVEKRKERFPSHIWPPSFLLRMSYFRSCKSFRI